MRWRERFLTFHRRNPDVYFLFKAKAREVQECGRKSYSARTIFETIRWEYDITTEGSSFKINNNFIPYYVRVLESDDPSFVGFFAKRRRG